MSVLHRKEMKQMQRKREKTRKHIAIANNMKLMSKDYANNG